MDSALVIKVKYGDTLRRFTAYPDETGLLDLDMNLLKQKIHSMFNFASDANLTLVYIDEDGDMVTLVDDEDLCEAISQDLNPLRINVSLNNTRAKRSKFRLKISCSCRRSCHVRCPLSPTDSGDFERPLKFLSDPILEAFHKIYVELIAKAISIVLMKFVDYLSKLESSLQGSLLECKEGKHNGEGFTSECPNDSKVTEDSQFSNGIVKQKPLPTEEIEDSMQKDFHQGKEPENVTTALKNSFPQYTPGFVVNNDLQVDSAASELSSLNGNSWVCPSDAVCNQNNNKAKEEECAQNSGNCTNSDCSAYLAYPFITIQDSRSSRIDSKPCESSSKKISYSGNTIYRVFHKGIRCDGCGMHPIVGPRFKSTVKEDYDLCNICFSDMGTMNEYIRLDHPVPVPHGARKPHLLMFDSILVKDVSIMHDTCISPNVPCIKIWKMLNVGTAPWPCGTHLVWTGGYQFANQAAVGLKIPRDGFPVGKNLDVAFTFTTPMKPGQHVSYWRMSLPSGEQFGEYLTIFVKVSTSTLVDASMSLQPISPMISI
ncbi:Phox/Bem1p [Corchorus olitorius]|uniref:Phox/Bem1p n=1 Tax=Corchorus olitorius TaxID=93759 RepID=A0A1R3IBU6_9ROSI|nr:Phox/Bem1p [Corchorus olitorius]